MKKKIELLLDIRTALDQLENGRGIDHHAAKSKILKQTSLLKTRLFRQILPVDDFEDILE